MTKNTSNAATTIIGVIIGLCIIIVIIVVSYLLWKKSKKNNSSEPPTTTIKPPTTTTTTTPTPTTITTIIPAYTSVTQAYTTFTPQTTATPTPKTIPNLQLWLDASNYNNFNFNNTTPNEITLWYDLSGYNRDATVFHTVNPLYTSNGLNSKPTISFRNMCAMSAPMPAGTTPTAMTVFVVSQRTGTSTMGSGQTIVSRTSAQYPRPLDISNTVRLVGGLDGTSNPLSSANSAYNISSSTSPNILLISTQQGSYKEYLNGELQLTYTYTTTFNDTNATAFYIGTREDKQTGFVGYMSEILVYNTILTDQQIQNISNYLSAKWSIPITFNSPVPRTIGNLQLWLDASQYGSLTFSNVAAGEISQWNDLSGNGRNATLYNTTKPAYTTSWVVDQDFTTETPITKPAIVFSASCAMSCPMPAGTTPTAMTVFVVYQKTGTTTAYQGTTIVSRTPASSGYPRPLDMYNTTRLTGGLNGTTNSYLGLASPFNISTDTNINIFACATQFNSYKEWVNGTLKLNTTGNPIFNDTNATAFYIGTRADKLTGFVGCMSEIIVYNTVLTDTEVSRVYNYLRSKWTM